MTVSTSYYSVIRRYSEIICYWRMNESSGTRAVDWAAKYDLNGIYDGISLERNYPLIEEDFAAGSKFFDGENQNMEVPTASPLQLINNMAIEMWAIIANVSQTCNLVGKMNSAFTFPNSYHLSLESGKLVFARGNGTTKTAFTSSSEISVGVPIHIVALDFNGAIKLLVDGNEVASGELGTQKITDGAQPVFVGELGNNTNRFVGNIGELAIYNNLSVAAAKEHFALGRKIIYQKPYYPQYDIPSYS